MYIYQFAIKDKNGVNITENRNAYAFLYIYI